MKQKASTAALALIAMTFSIAAFSEESPVGVWRTYDDHDGLPASLIQIDEKNGLLEGHVLEILERPGKKKNPVCENCEGENKNQPIVGMKVIWDMKPDGGEFTGGKIFDPESGHTYRCKIKVAEGKLEVRGFLGISLIGRSQIWIRAK